MSNEHGKGILERFEKGDADFKEVERFVRVIVSISHQSAHAKDRVNSSNSQSS